MVASAVYSAPNTTVTILFSTEYPISNQAIIASAVSDLDSPQGWPDWFTWVPTFSANGSMTYTGVTPQLGKYRVTGRMIHFVFRALGTLGGTASNGIHVTLPVTPMALTGQFIPVTGGNNETTLGIGTLDTIVGRVTIFRYDSLNFTLGASKSAICQGFYEW